MITTATTIRTARRMMRVLDSPAAMRGVLRAYSAPRNAFLAAGLKGAVAG
jgi:hypothetical protein